uniref:SF4 helicase domain-containing protein n=1 Tax=Chenopodium quinoa TaxID=63459 RepID=A0A803MID8_CHEQI
MGSGGRKGRKGGGGGGWQWAPVEGSTPKSARLNKLMKKLDELGIEGHEAKGGQYNKLLCPMCKGGDSGEHSLSLHISEDGTSAVWLCFRGKCGWQGNTMVELLFIVVGFGSLLAAANAQSSFGKLNKMMTSGKRELTEKSLGLEPLCNELLAYFAERMITAETLRRNYVMQKTFGNQIVIAFTYMRNGVLTSCKYRDVTKKFWQEADTERIFYGLDDIKNASDIIIVEGEIDKLAMEEAGLHNCVSVPDGAPPKVSDKGVPSPDKDTKYQFLWNCKEYFEKASRIILATDGDPPGQALSEELARRFGRERCWRVKWPKKNDFDYYKDANEVLMYLGPEKLKETIDNAEIYPIQGLFSFRDYFHEIDAYYDMALGDELGVSTGWRCLDEYYNVVPGELTIVTGVPNSGKSEWIDALLCNLNESVGWKFALCSMENKVREHARKLLEKHIKKPFFDVRCENDSLPNIKWVLDLAKAAVLRHGVRGLVIDPYNELDHQRLSSMCARILLENMSSVGANLCPEKEVQSDQEEKGVQSGWGSRTFLQLISKDFVAHLLIHEYIELWLPGNFRGTETEYVSQMLTMVKRFAQHHSCHVWFVAHPRQLHNWVGNAPNLYDISGSAHFINKCDNGIVVHRNRDPEAGPIDRVQICVRKVRNKVAGTIGDTYLTYKRITGEFVEPFEPKH